jgi:integrase
MASLRRFPRSPYWFACYAGPDGRRRQCSTKETDKKRAMKIAERFEGVSAIASQGLLTAKHARKILGEIYEISNRESLPSDTIGEFFPRWLASVKVQCSPKTYQRYCGVVERFLKWLGPRQALGIQHLTSVDLVRFRDYLAREHSPSSVNLSLGALQAGLSRAFDDRLVDVNEAARVPRLEDNLQNKQERRAFTDAELRAVLNVADQEWKGMILCGAYTGMRLGDVSLLRWENIDLAAAELRFKTEKTSREMVIPIADPLHRYLIDIAGNDTPRAPLFPKAFATRHRDIPTGTLSNQFYRLMTAAGVVEKRTNKKQKTGLGRSGRRKSGGLGFHCLRHTATTLLKRAGASDVVAREIIGHETAAISRTYSHIDTATLRTAIDKMPDLTSEPPEP